MFGLMRGRYRARLASDAADISRALRLRWLCFLAGNSAAHDLPDSGEDSDDLDAICQHVLIEEVDTGRLVCCFRMFFLTGDQITGSYSARYYDLEALRDFDAPMIEIGRFCIHPEARDPDILRVAWGALTRHVDAMGVGMLFGCSSFTGTDPGAHLDAFAMLKDRHLAPRRWLPRVKAPDVFRFARILRRRRPDARRAQAELPPLLRTYLLMGGWVSDHAVIDRYLNTLHVFTGLEVRAIPAARKRLLRAVVG